VREDATVEGEVGGAVGARDSVESGGVEI